MVTVEALKLLYRKLGGSADIDKVTAISEMVDLIEDVAGSGGGGAGGLVVNVTKVEGQENQYTIDKNYTEIKTAVEAGITPMFIKSSSDDFIGDASIYALIFAECSKSVQAKTGTITCSVTALDIQNYIRYVFEAHGSSLAHPETMQLIANVDS